MNNANFEFEMNHNNPWSRMTSGAKVATVIAGMGVGAASIAASLFLAGAALFSGLVFVSYQWLSGKTPNTQTQNTVSEQ